MVSNALLKSKNIPQENSLSSILFWIFGTILKMAWSVERRDLKQMDFQKTFFSFKENPPAFCT